MLIIKKYINIKKLLVEDNLLILQHTTKISISVQNLFAIEKLYIQDLSNSMNSTMYILHLFTKKIK